MTSENAGDAGSTSGRDEDDRVVSRRVDNPTAADPGDAATYRAADPLPDADSAGDPTEDTVDRQTGGGTAESAKAEMRSSDESEPTHSE